MTAEAVATLVTEVTPFDDLDPDIRLYKGNVEHRTELTIDQVKVVALASPVNNQREMILHRARWAWTNRRSATNPDNIVVYIPEGPYLLNGQRLDFAQLVGFMTENPDLVADMAALYKKAA